MFQGLCHFPRPRSTEGPFPRSALFSTQNVFHRKEELWGLGSSGFQLLWSFFFLELPACYTPNSLICQMFPAQKISRFSFLAFLKTQTWETVLLLSGYLVGFMAFWYILHSTQQWMPPSYFCYLKKKKGLFSSKYFQISPYNCGKIQLTCVSRCSCQTQMYTT